MMIDSRQSGGSPATETAADASGHQRPLTLRADVVALAGRELWNEVESLLPSKIPVQQFTSPDEFRESLSGNVAVALLPASLGETRLRELVIETLCSSEHARVVLLATDGTELLDVDLPHDAGFVFPEEADEFESLIKRLYVRAYYCVAIRRYYTIGLSIRNREIQIDGQTDDELERLRAARDRIDVYLETFRRYLGPEDFETISDRNDRLDEFLGSQVASRDPTQIGLPTSCPQCHLDWTTNYAQQNGYERIGANTWRCRNCSYVLANTGPDNYRVS